MAGWLIESKKHLFQLKLQQNNFKFNTGNYSGADNQHQEETQIWVPGTGGRNVPVLAKNSQATQQNMP